MLVAGPQRGLFIACLGIGVGSLLLLDLQLAPAAITAAAQDMASASATLATPAPEQSTAASGASAPATAEPALIESAAQTAQTAQTRTALSAAARVPTIVARFDRESNEPSDLSGVRALAAAMIEDHEVTVVLEGHSDTYGGQDFNQTISLARADWVKERVVALGVTAERIETVGLGATRPLRSDTPDAQAINRRVEVRWIGR